MNDLAEALAMCKFDGMLPNACSTQQAMLSDIDDRFLKDEDEMWERIKQSEKAQYVMPPVSFDHIFTGY